MTFFPQKRGGKKKRKRRIHSTCSKCQNTPSKLNMKKCHDAAIQGLSRTRQARELKDPKNEQVHTPIRGDLEVIPIPGRADNWTESIEI